MITFKTLVFTVSSLLLVQHSGAGSTETGQIILAPVLSDDEASYYFKLRDVGRSVHNYVEFDEVPGTDSQVQVDQSTRTLSTISRQINYQKVLDLITITETNEDGFTLDSVSVESHEYDDIERSVYLQHPSSDQEIIIFVDPEGQCHRRVYTIHHWQFTATVQRSKVESISCPNSIVEKVKGAKGTVLNWAPEGLALQTYNLVEPHGQTSAAVTTLDFPDPPGYKLVCTTETAHSETNNRVYSATVLFQGMPLDRFKLNPEKCSIENIAPKTISEDEREKLILITFKTPGEIQRRNYKLSIENYLTHDKITVTRTIT